MALINQDKEYNKKMTQLDIWNNLLDQIKLINKIDNNIIINKHKRFVNKNTASNINLNKAKYKSVILLKELVNTRNNYDLKKDSVIRTIEKNIDNLNKSN